MPTVAVVVGAGVIGLSSALALQDAGHSVTIVARDLPAPFCTIDPVSQIDYTSPWGGAHNRVVPPPKGNDYLAMEHALSLVTFEKMEQIHAQSPETAGITFMKAIEYLEKPGEEYISISENGSELGLREFRLLKSEELPDDVKWGCEYTTWCVNPMAYCCFLLNKFVYRGGTVVKRELKALEEVFTLSRGLVGGEKIDVVVNASGAGFGDKDVFPTRGQTCLVANPCYATVTRQKADGSWSFSVPRNFEGGTIIGGTKEPNDLNPHPDRKVRNKLLAAFSETYPEILVSEGECEGKEPASEKGFRVLADIVGRRPTRRGGMRLEKEELPGGESIVHAYGLGGRGYELSWGVASKVTKLAS